MTLPIREAQASDYKGLCDLFEEVDAGGWGITLGEPRPADGPGAEGGPR